MKTRFCPCGITSLTRVVLHIPSQKPTALPLGMRARSLAQQNTCDTSRESRMDLCSCSICEVLQVLVISNLVVGASVPLVLRQVSNHFHRITHGNRQNATTAAGLPVHLSSRSNGRGGSGVNSCQRFLRVYNFDCAWRLDSTIGRCFTIWALDVCGRVSAGENVRRA